ncbi:hypothetical protein ACFOY8_12565 [Thalassospira xianhensis]|uniref:Uncharacterized protein n=1 Tax=Thalassospira xianhensis MCCC 1A02616 TaxID=1177929 RepID=A0A367UG63_9PROT|nr:hypothetical protein [Thalassospira xianhensis]RCK06304.1 hypothetical protein TH5_08865 [Thalassospira xianhensis MCCC 1A02616]
MTDNAHAQQLDLFSYQPVPPKFDEEAYRQQKVKPAADVLPFKPTNPELEPESPALTPAPDLQTSPRPASFTGRFQGRRRAKQIISMEERLKAEARDRAMIDEFLSKGKVQKLETRWAIGAVSLSSLPDI